MKRILIFSLVLASIAGASGWDIGMNATGQGLSTLDSLYVINSARIGTTLAVTGTSSLAKILASDSIRLTSPKPIKLGSAATSPVIKDTLTSMLRLPSVNHAQTDTTWFQGARTGRYLTGNGTGNYLATDYFRAESDIICPSFNSTAATATFYGLIDVADASLAHGRTTLVPTNIYFRVVEQGGAVGTGSGGAQIYGVSGNNAGVNPIELRAVSGHATPTAALFLLRGGAATGTTWTNVAASARLFQLENLVTPLFNIWGNGNLTLGGDSTNWKADSTKLEILYTGGKVNADTFRADKGLELGAGTMLTGIYTGNATGWTLQNTSDTNLVSGATVASRISLTFRAVTATLTAPLTGRTTVDTLFINCAAADTAAVRAGSVDYLIFK